ncbi:CDP-alcohol phosphatidyltransferase family protein [Actinocrinis puniceicyclus]|uniref:CDP-alcohol phosphatidyltransferase family protein n=1 Tax=Actinocrinis puniceicyclus TaxID=977794 RepID=A0A8J7WNA8_9ACTN|nr:CDP-alcohol phosphatidyltransferase family protein [Actinocrinis puniceicyclus]MBS2962569.1 CDP-alcohol phosphatidyltransferase family protein [Actinocrinis puniceicyclus]
MSTPTLDELRLVVQPAEKMQRRSGEHWAGRLYMRWVSLRVTRRLVNSPISANGYTYLMIVAGLAAGAALLIPGLAGALVGALLIQVYLLLDCVDGELARWRKQTSIVGVYLDRIGAYAVEAAFLAGLGFRADRLHAGPWAVLGLAAAAGILVVKSETDLVDVARARSGLPAVAESASVPRSTKVARARVLASAFKVHRLIVVIETSLLVLAAGILDAVAGGGASGLFYTRLAVALLAAIALAMVFLHFVSIVMSSRLKG